MTKRSSLAAIGEPVVRKEDAELLTGQGRFSDDVNLPGQAYAVMVRSPHAHARIRSIDVAAAMAVPGAIAVLTGVDAIKDGLKPIPHRCCECAHGRGASVPSRRRLGRAG